MIPRVGEPVKSGKRYKVRPGAYAILERNGQVLLTRQADPIPEVQLPGGGTDPGEQTLSALHREIAEETGWSAGRLRRVGAYRRFTYMPEYDLWAEKICHVFVGRPARLVGAPIEPGHTALWAEPEVAIDLVGSDGDRLFLQRVFGHRT